MPTVKIADLYQLTPKDIVPVAVPTSAEDVSVGDLYLEELQFTNTSGAALTITVTDKQGSPLSILDTMSIDTKALYIMSFHSRWCPGGLRWVASGSGIVGYVKFRQ